MTSITMPPMYGKIVGFSQHNGDFKVVLVFPDNLEVDHNSCHCFCVELVKLLPLHQYSVDIFLYSGSSGILGSD